MEIFILVGLIVLALAVGLTFLFYWIPKKMRYPKLGKILSTIVGFAFVVLTGLIIFEDQLFSKNDARKLLAEQDIILTEKFEIIENKSMSAIGDYYHTFSLRISIKDKQMIIRQIKSSQNFKGLNERPEDISHTEDRYKGKKIIQSYEDSLQFVREYFEPNGVGCAPTYRKVEIDKKGNLLTFEDIDE